MIRVSVSEVKADFSRYLNQAAYGNKRVLITSRGKAKAILLGIEDMKRLEALEKAIDQAEVSISPQNRRLLDLLHTAPDDDKDPAWWADFERELADNRFNLREREF
jgi:prevent-host-death family protein